MIEAKSLISLSIIENVDNFIIKIKNFGKESIRSQEKMSN